MYSLPHEDSFRKTSIIRSNLLSATRVDIDSLVKCLQTEKSLSRRRSKQKQKLSNQKELYKTKLSRGYFPNKYKVVEPALRIRFNELEGREILVPSEVQAQAHIVNVSFGVIKRKKPKARPQQELVEKLPLSLTITRPKTSNVKRPTFLVDWSQQKKTPLRTSQHRYRQKSYSPTKIRPEEIEFTNQQIVTLNPTLNLINKSNKTSIKGNDEDQIQQRQQQLASKTYGMIARKSAPFDTKSSNLKKDFFYKRKLMMRKDHFTFSLGEGKEKRITSDQKVELYRDFLWKVNFSNGLYVDAELEAKRLYKVYVGSGNNSTLVKSLMKRRFWWMLVDKPTEDANFVWTQLKLQSVFKAQARQAEGYEKLNNYSNSVTVSTIDYSRYMHSKQRQQQNNPSSHCKHHSKIFRGENMDLWNKHYSRNYKTENTINDRTYSRRVQLMKKKPITSIEKSDNLIVHNHFKGNSYIGNKKAMFYNLKLYYTLRKRDVFGNIPITFHIVKGVNDPEFKRFLEMYGVLEKEKEKNKGKNVDKAVHNIWIMKPGEFTNRGKGITVCGSLQQILTRLKGKQKNADGSTRTFILQKYIEKPLLYFNRKFDIRHYMLITCINKKIKGYWFQEGYIRTSSTEYTLKNCKNTYIHLTNDAVQKHSEDYGKYEKGNKLSYQEFQKYLDNEEAQLNLNFFDTVLPEMKRIASDAIKSTYSLLAGERLEHNFQIFGLDYMVDENLTTYLIQINTNPCLQLSSPLLAKIIPGMLSNALMIGLDPLFPPPYNWPSNKKYQLSDTPLENNKFELIFDESHDGAELAALYSNVKKIDERMGNIEDEEEEYPEEEGEGKWSEENV